MKSLVALSIVLILVAITEGSIQLPFSEADLDFFANLKFEQLPWELKIALRKSTRAGDSSNWCCVNNVPIKTIQRTKVVMNSLKVQTTVQTGYRKCNFWGKRCPTYDTKYTTKAVYHVGTYEVPDPTKCAERDIRCCEHHLKVAGDCLSLSDAAKYTDMLVKLKQAGALNPVG